MELPSIVNTLVDKQRNITYEIVAYRKLTREELILAVRNFHSQKKKLKVKPNKKYKIMSSIGCNG